MLRSGRNLVCRQFLVCILLGAGSVTGGACGGGGSDASGSGGTPGSGGATGGKGSGGAGLAAGTGGESPSATGGNIGGGGNRGGTGAVTTGGDAGSGAGGGGKSGNATGGSAGGRGGSGTGGQANGGSGGAGGGTPIACPSPALKAGNTTRTVQVGGKTRSYVLHIPAKYDGAKPAALVVDFHGLGGTASGEVTGSPYPAQTDPDGAVMAFPAGLSGSLGTSWNLGTCCVDADDVGFTRALVADTEKVACIDPKHVYAVGFSLGGGMTQYLGCEAADLFAAVAPAAADLVQETVGMCKPARPITVITFRGTADGNVKYTGGSVSPNASMPLTGLGAKASFDKWAQIDQCTGAASPEDKNGCASYTTCAGGAEVILCTKQGGGHEPGNASVGWPVLKRHALP